MADANEHSELLFFDTFSHENLEELNLDLVQFPLPVKIYEIRIIPLRAQVQARLPGGVRLGATNPSAFKLELFVNNLTRPNSSTFEKLGLLDYKENANIQLKPETEVLTDGLVLKGWYNAITAAIYGCVVSSNPAKVSPPHPPSWKTQADTRTEPTPITEEELCKSAPGTQHPLDFIQQQLQQLQQRYIEKSQTAAPASSVDTSDVSSALSPSVMHQVQSAAVDIYKPFEDLLQPHPHGNSTHSLSFPPEPKEPFGSHHHERSAEKDDRTSHGSRDNDRDDWDFRSRRHGSVESGDSCRNYRSSHDGSYECRRNTGDDDGHHSYDDGHGINCRKDDSWDASGVGVDRDVSDVDRVDEDNDIPSDHGRILSCEQQPGECETESWDVVIEGEDWNQLEDVSHSFTMPSQKSELSHCYSRSPSPLTHDSKHPDASRSSNEEMEVGRSAPHCVIYDDLADIEIYGDLLENSTGVSNGPKLNVEQAEEEDGYEDISSDDELNYAEDTDITDTNQDFSEDLPDDSWEETNPALFNPFQFYLTPLCTLTDPSLTAYEVVGMKQCSLSDDGKREMPSEAQHLFSVIEEYRDAQRNDRWVIALEAAPPLIDKGLSFLLEMEKEQGLLDVLVGWVVHGLCEEEAMRQAEATFKVRHLKMGISLATALFICCPLVSVKLSNSGVQSMLLDLLESKVMAFTIRLLILKAINASLHFSSSVCWLIGSQDDASRPSVDPPHSSYQRIVLLMTQKQLPQVMIGLKDILQRVHAYLTFTKLRDTVDRVLSQLPRGDEVDDSTAAGAKGEDEGEDVGNADGCFASVKEDDARQIVLCLQQVHRLFASPHGRHATQQQILLPVRPFSDTCPNDSLSFCRSLLRFASDCRLLECLFVLMSSGALASHTAVFASTHHVIQTLLRTQEGLLFLAARPDATNGLIRAIIQLQDDSCEDLGVDALTRLLALEMVYHLCTLQHVDQLMDHHRKASGEMKLDDPDAMNILQSLHSMTFSTGMSECIIARRVIAHVMSLGDNFSCMLPFLQPLVCGELAADIHRSLCWSYVVQLTTVVLMHADSAAVVRKYGASLLSICEHVGTAGKLHQLQEWVAPVSKLSTFGVEDLPNIISLLKTHVEDVSKLPPGLVTVLRILHRVTIIPPQDSLMTGDDARTPLSPSYAVVEMYSADCLPTLVSILQKMSESELRPWQQGLPRPLNFWAMFFATMLPTLALVKRILSCVIHARGSEFRDQSILPTLLELHTVVCSVPSSSLYSADCSKVQKEIVDTLLSFTQPFFESKGDESLSSSLWTLTMKEVFRYTIKSPYTYMSGLLLISELMPLPFPLLTKEPLSEEEVLLSVNMRKLWSAHLHPLHPELLNIIKLLSGTSCQPLLCLLRRVCWQIADLTAPSATIVARCLLDLYMDEKEYDDVGEEKSSDIEKEAPGGISTVSLMTAKILSLISYLLSQPGIKSAILQLISMRNGEEKYRSILPSLIQTLNCISLRSHHVQTQEAIVCNQSEQRVILCLLDQLQSVLQSLCDQEITLIHPESSLPIQEQLANTLPVAEIMSLIVGAFMDHLGNPSHSYASFLPCVRTLVMLTEHDYGFYHLKTGLEEHPGALCCLLHHISQTFSRDSSDCLSTLSTSLELIRQLTSRDCHADQDAALTRTLTRHQLVRILDWVPERRHPLQDLEEMAKAEEALESLTEVITLVFSALEDTDCERGQECEEGEVVLPAPLPLSELFAQRSVYALSDGDDDRLSASCWLSNPALEELDEEPEAITCDLLDLCKRYLVDLDLEKELRKECVLQDENIVWPKHPCSGRKRGDTIRIKVKNPGDKPFVAPMRGRGFSVHGSKQRGGGQDMFRSRAPNTSRPPSMHVDEFVKLENISGKCDGGQAAQIQPEAIQPIKPIIMPPLRRNKDGSRGRGRGWGGGRGGLPLSRGSFFAPPPFAYQRRDASQNDLHNLQLFVSQQLLMESYKQKQLFPMFHQFGHAGGLDVLPYNESRREPQIAGNMVNRRGGQENRFVQRGRGSWFGGSNKDNGSRRFQKGGGGVSVVRGRRDPDRHQRPFSK